MSSQKEREILERQRMLAARLNPGAQPPKPMVRAKKKAPPAPVQRKKVSMTGQIIDLTVPPKNGNNVLAAAAAAAKKAPTKKTAPPTGPPQKRPTLKRPSSQKAGLAAAKASAIRSSSSSSISNRALSVSAGPAAHPKKDGKPSPRVARKAMGKAPASSLVAGNSSLASLVKSATNGNDDAMEGASLPVHQPDDFWKNMRDWDVPSQYYHQQQEQPSNADNDTFTRKPLPNTFLNPRHYVAAWAPLCLAECRAQLLQEVVQNMTQPVLVEVKSTANSRVRHNRNNHHGGTVGQYDAPWLEENETGGHVIVQPKQGRVPMTFMANDLVLLLQPQYKDILRDISNGRAAPPDGHDPESINVFAGISLVGHTESARRELAGLVLKVSKRKFAVTGKKEMYLVKIGSNVTALREFTALCGVETLPMKKFLLGQHLEKAENRRKLSRHQSMDQLLSQIGGDNLGQGFLNYAKNKFNHSQLTAIAASAHEYGEGGFTLIKGPPGTGKTTTLCAVLNSLHIRQYNKYYDEVRRIATKPTGSRENALAMARKAKPRLLVCAPSNAAIDNIILKIMEDGFVDGQGNRYNPSMIRVGRGQGNEVRDVSLDNKVDEIFADNVDAQQLQSSIAGYRAELSRVSNEMASVRRRAYAIQSASPWPLSQDWEIRIDEENFDQSGKAFFVNHKQKVTTYEIPPPPEPGEPQFKTTAMPEYRQYLSRIVKLVESFFSLKSHLERSTLVKSSMDAGSNQFEVRMNLESHVLNSVHMVMTTLGTAGNRTLEAADRFEVIVVDEAAQSVEPASLSALRLGSRHAVLVGDPQQLPATIFNVSGKNSKYDRSLFQRLEESGQPVYMLNEQYRMHPAISFFPRQIFYSGALLDGPNVSKADYGNPLRAMICRAAPAVSPFMILDLDSKEERGGTSLSNLSEAKLAVYLYEQLKTLSRGLSTSTKVAVITPYAQQCKLLRRSFSDLLGPRYENSVEVNTVDAFQGREANVVIFSAVRAAGSHGIGFLSDVRRMNVALTRAKHFLFVIARCESIVVNPYWFDLVQHARKTNAVVRVPMMGGGATASFGQMQSWKVEQPSVAVGTGAAVGEMLPDDPRRKKQRC